MTGALSTLGGVGLFLVGMIVLTDALQALASGAVRRALARFTRSPSSGALVGALATALVQSSTAITVAAVGFVSAGVLTFPQAFGVVLGANVGTTITGWLVVLVGFKLQLGHALLPLILAGASMRLFGGARTANVGMALAGFALVFVGIETLQRGLVPLQGVVTPDTFPPDTWGGRALLVVFGVAATLITHSSSSGVAAALAALHAGTIALPQAAALVIGMEVGTTATAALATVGGRTPARRTGFAHVLYNCMTAAAAFSMLPLLVRGWEASFGAGVEPEIALVAFHTFINVAGLVVVLPMTGTFVRLTERMFPDRDELGRRLDPQLLQTPALAIGVALATARDVALRLLPAVRERLRGERDGTDRLWQELDAAAVELRHYLGRIAPDAADGSVHASRLAAMHAADHLDRLVDRCRSAVDLAPVCRTPEVTPVLEEFVELLGAEWNGGSVERFERVARALGAERESFRATTLGRAAAGGLSTDATLALLDGHRWLAHAAYHCFRLVHHLTRPLDVLTERMSED